MYRRPALREFAAFARLYRAAARAVEAGAPQPYTDDPVMNAYDLRPRAPLTKPSEAVALKALSFMGYRRHPGMDRGVFMVDCVKRLWAYILASDDVDYADYEILNLIVSFRNYAELSEGRKIKWKLLRP